MEKLLSVLSLAPRENGRASAVIKQLEPFIGRVEIFACSGGEKQENVFEIEAADRAQFIETAIKAAKGKYLIFIDSDAAIDGEGFSALIDALSSAAVDLVLFEKPALRCAFCAKTALLKKADRTVSLGDALIGYSTYSFLNANSFTRIKARPLTFSCELDFAGAFKNPQGYMQAVKESINKFNEGKAKLAPTVYKTAFDFMGGLLLAGYASGILMLADGKIKPEQLATHDEALKKRNPRLHASVETLPKAGKLKKLRENKFKKLPFGTKKKILAALKKNGIDMG